MDDFSGHTPGPWEWGLTDPAQGWCGIIVNTPRAFETICDIPGQSAEAKANARLIAAAPDLLAERDRLRAEVERLQDHIENVAKDTQRLLMERDAENERLRAAAQEGRTDLLIAANNARDAAKTDPRWQGVAEKLMARVAMIDAVLEAQEPTP